MGKKIAFIVNPKSGNASKWDIEDLVNTQIDPEKFSVRRVVFTQAPGHGRQLALGFIADGFEIVVAVGGDGTVNEVAGALIHTPVALGIISTGSGNGLARHLKISTQVRKALQMLNASESIKIDYGLR